MRPQVLIWSLEVIGLIFLMAGALLSLWEAMKR
jgi:hypothetical protein